MIATTKRSRRLIVAEAESKALAARRTSPPSLQVFRALQGNDKDRRGKLHVVRALYQCVGDADLALEYLEADDENFQRGQKVEVQPGFGDFYPGQIFDVHHVNRFNRRTYNVAYYDGCQRHIVSNVDEGSIRMPRSTTAHGLSPNAEQRRKQREWSARKRRERWEAAERRRIQQER